VERLLRWLLGSRDGGPAGGDESMKVILALGNPGPEYERTRHNIGWWVAEHLAKEWSFEKWRKDGEARVAVGRVGTTVVRLVEPLGYYNRSGSALRPYLRRPTWDAARDLLVVCDDVALPVGRFRLRASGSSGGNNGLKSVEQALAGRDYARLRIGTRPADERRQVGDLADFVLSPFGKSEREEVMGLFPDIASMIERWIRGGVEAALSQHPAN
jgi:peptidyl-tRNA hydrolase, PTH1 family